VNPLETKAKEVFEEDGWKVYHTGYPDFFVVRGKDFAFIEIKSSVDPLLNPAQKRMVRAMKKVGLPVEVITLKSVTSTTLIRAYRDTLQKIDSLADKYETRSQTLDRLVDIAKTRLKEIDNL